MSWLSELLEGGERAGRAISDAVRTIADVATGAFLFRQVLRPFGEALDDYYAGQKLAREASEAQKDADARAAAARKAADEAAGRLPLSRRRTRLGYNEYIPQYFGYHRITPVLYQPTYYESSHLDMTPLGVANPSGFKDSIYINAVLGMGTYSAVSPSTAFIGRTPLASIVAKTGNSQNQIIYSTTATAHEAYLQLPSIQTSARQADNDGPSNSLIVQDSDLTEWITIWENKADGRSGSHQNRYFLAINGQFNSLRDAYPVKLRLQVRATFTKAGASDRTYSSDGYVDYSASSRYNTSGTGTHMLDPSYNGTFRFLLEDGGIGLDNYPITQADTDYYLTKIDIRVGSLRKNMTIYSGKIEARTGSTDPRFRDRTVSGFNTLNVFLLLPGGEQTVDTSLLNINATRRIYRWTGSAYALTADNANGYLQARNAYAIAEHLLHHEWGLIAADGTSSICPADELERLRGWRDLTADTYDGTLNPDQGYFQNLETVLAGTRVVPIVTRGGLRFIRDEMLPPSALFTEADVSGVRLSQTLRDSTDGLEVNYYDPDNETEATLQIGQDGDITIVNNQYVLTPGTTPLQPETLNVSGLRGRTRALRFLHQEFLAFKYRREGITFTAGPEADTLNNGDVVYLQMFGAGDTAEIIDIHDQSIQLSRSVPGPTLRFRNPSGAFTPEFTLASTGDRITIDGGSISGTTLTVGSDVIHLEPGATRVITSATGQLWRVKILRVQGSGSAGGVRISGIIDDPRAYPEDTEGTAVQLSAPTTLTTQFVTALQTLSSWRLTNIATYQTNGEYQLWQDISSAAWFIRRISGNGDVAYVRSSASTQTATQAWADRATLSYTA